MKLALITSALIISFSGHSQLSAYSSHREDSAVSCITHWKLGETKTYSIVHEKKSINPPGKNPPFRFAYEASVSVIDSSAKNYTIKWIFHLPEEMSILRPRLADSLPVYNGMQMIFRITEMGEFVELLNWEEVRDAYARMMELSMPKKMDSTAAAALKFAKNMYNSKAMVESSMIQEIQLFHRPYGYKFTTTETGSKTEIGNPFGGDPFPAIQTIRVSDPRPKADTFNLSFHLRIDKANTTSMIDSLLKKMNIKDDREMQVAREKYANFDMHDFSEYSFIRSNGWIRRLYYERTVDIAGMTQSDAYTFTLKD